MVVLGLFLTIFLRTGGRFGLKAAAFDLCVRFHFRLHTSLVTDSTINIDPFLGRKKHVFKARSANYLD